MKMNRYLILLALLLMGWGCGTSKKTADLRDDGLITFNFVQLNDVYEIAPLGGGAYGGMARVAYLTDSIRLQNPNTFLFLAGDFLSPSLLGTLEYEGTRIKGRQMIEVMNAMDFDLVTFGNHEFDLSRQELQQRLDKSRFKWLSSNVNLREGDSLKPFSIKGADGKYREIPRYLVLTISDTDGTEAKIGFYGSTLNENPVPYVDYGDVLQEARNAYQTIRDSSDVLIGLTHLTIDQDKELAGICPETSLIMGGHEHNNMLHQIGNTLIAKADANARTVYLHRITHNVKTHRTTVVSTLVTVDEKLQQQPEVKQVVEKWEKVLNRQIETFMTNPNQVIYMANPPLDGTDAINRSAQTELGDIITSAMIAGFDEKPQAALVNSGSFRLDDMLEGPVTPIDVMRVLPFAGQVQKVDITGELLLKVLDYGLARRGSGAYLQRKEIKRTASGKWMIGNKEITGSGQYYTIAISDFLLKGYDIPFLTADNPGILRVYDPSKSEPSRDIRIAVINYLKNL
jgi:2',3'-cyclic-nucleotide 2'-phosphodiesterase (5'-nucleotidase family)